VGWRGLKSRWFEGTAGFKKKTRSLKQAEKVVRKAKKGSDKNPIPGKEPKTPWPFGAASFLKNQEGLWGGEGMVNALTREYRSQ